MSEGTATLGRGYGHGKIVLVGEHAVVYGHPAIAAGMSAGVAVSAQLGSGRLSVPAWGLEAAAGDGSEVGRALAAVVRRLEAPGLDFAGEAQIPSRAGLGSSAALAVAVARAAAEAAGRSSDDPAIAAAVTEAEAIFHGNASGIDAAAASSGRVGWFTRAEGWRPLAVAQTIRLCVGLSGRHRDTAAQVSAVARLRERLATADRMLSLLGELAGEATTALGCGDVDGLGRVFDAAHGLLSGLRLSTPELETLVGSARAAGAVGAKLTGAGGGGAVIAIAPGHERDVMARWQSLGFAGFVAEIAASPGAGASAGPAPGGRA